MTSFESDEESRLTIERSRSMKKRNIGMEAKGGEVRKIHILYFISRMGRVEHPHLIRVRHLNRNGVYLRDVKRWLAELRGKDMAEAFAWSYKRKYKTGYVWQDLVDDDLITPISDNEYVLKGSQINPIPFGGNHSHFAEKNAVETVDGKQIEIVQEKQKQKQSCTEEESHLLKQSDSKTNITRKVSLDITQESSSFSADSERSTLSSGEYDSFKLDEEKLLCEEGKAEGEQHENHSTFSFHHIYSLLNKKGKNTGNKDKTDTTDSSPSSLSSPQITFTRSKSYSNEAAYMFRKLISCRTVDTNDAVLFKTNKDSTTVGNKPCDKHSSMVRIAREQNLGGSARVCGTPRNQQQQEQKHNARKSFDGVKGSDRSKKQKDTFTNQKAASAVHKQFRGPKCSQCGMSFRPERMHSHMKSCKGMKALAKNAAAAAAGSVKKKMFVQQSNTTACKESSGPYLLTT